jgi:hypothetical protein
MWYEAVIIVNSSHDDATMVQNHQEVSYILCYIIINNTLSSHTIQVIHLSGVRFIYCEKSNIICFKMMFVSF